MANLSRGNKSLIKRESIVINESTYVYEKSVPFWGMLHKNCMVKTAF